MNKKISMVMLILFITTFSALFIFNDIFSNLARDEFYAQEFDAKKKILLYGSSHVIQLNNTLIETELKSNHLEFTLINMAEGANTPKKRILNVEKDLKLNPEIIFYGLGFRDLNDIQKKDNQNNDFNIKNLIPVDIVEIETMNPKLTTLEVLRSIFFNTLSNKQESKIPYPNNSIFQEKKIEKIATDEQLKEFSKNEPALNINIKNNEQLEYLEKIIQKLQTNDVKIVLFITPHCSHYLESISEGQSEKFYTVLEDLEKKFGINIHDFSYKYEKLPIWRDCTHVAYNPDAMIYSKDVSEMIIKELNN